MINDNSETVEPKSVVVELHYLPCIDYIAALAQFENVIFEVNEYFQKQTYRNRCYLSGANKMETLIVPLIHGGKKALLKDVQIDYSESWTRVHWNCIKSAYGKSPFFEYYAHDFERVYEKKEKFLVDLNFNLLTICLDKLHLHPIKSYSLSYIEKSDEVFDARNAINNKKNRENYKFTLNRPYYQTFGKGFLPNLSVADLLFNTGPEAGKVIFPLTKSSNLENLNKQEKIFVKA